MNPASSRAFMVRVLLLSVIAFATSLLVVPLMPGLGSRALWGGYFPYVPFVWAPVAISHVVIFLHASRLVPKGTLPVWLGSGIVFVAAGVGLGMLAIAGLQDRLTWLFAGVTAPGYALVGFGWKRISLSEIGVQKSWPSNAMPLQGAA